MQKNRSNSPVKIKGILFDMDGVLIEAKDWHYEALNRALDPFGMAISREAHLSTFDGLPTRKKLRMLTQIRGLPEQLHEFLNSLKQQITLELTYARCKPVFHHQYALSSLNRMGYKMAVCSNSVRNTVEVMMKLSDLEKYLDVLVSNEDVSKPKPDPEMYNKAMEYLGLMPEECLILEDNEHGLQAARASGAYVMHVITTEDVNLTKISEVIQKIEGKIA